MVLGYRVGTGRTTEPMSTDNAFLVARCELVITAKPDPLENLRLLSARKMCHACLTNFLVQKSFIVLYTALSLIRQGIRQMSCG